MEFAFPGAPVLDDVVERYWWLPAGPPVTIQLWPGTGSEIVWPNGPASLRSGLGEVALHGPTVLVVRRRRAQLVLPPGTSLLVARLRAGALPRIGLTRAADLVDQPAPWAAGGRALPDRRPDTLWDGLDLLQPVLARLISRQRLNRVAGTIDRYYRSPATLTVARAADLAAVSERQLRRDFPAAVGVSPKQFQRLVRFQRTLKDVLLAQHGPRPHDLGYADQSHQIRDFVSFAGMPPSSLRRAEPVHTFFTSRA